MLQRFAHACALLVVASSVSFAQSPNGVRTLSPTGAIKAEGTWSLGARAGDFVFVAGMQGIDPATNTLVPDPAARIRQAFLNIRSIAQSEGASLQDCVRVSPFTSVTCIVSPRWWTKRRRSFGAGRHIRPVR